MHRIFLALLPATLAAQTADSALLQALISEIRELRLAVERSTLVGAKAQMALSRVQLHEAAAARLAREHADAAERVASAQSRQAEGAERLKHLEQTRSTPAYADPREREQIDHALRQVKRDMEEAAADAQRHSAREADLAQQARNAQGDTAAARARVAEIERALDAVLQQMMKRP